MTTKPPLLPQAIRWLALLALLAVLARLLLPAPKAVPEPAVPLSPAVRLEKEDRPPKGRIGEVRLEKLDVQLTKEAAAAKTLEALEKAAVAAIMGDKALSPGQRKAKLADVRADFSAERRSLRSFPKNAASKGLSR